MQRKIMVLTLLACFCLAVSGCVATQDTVEKTDKWLKSDVYDYM
jgi:starvation-inducible outer membrane lipoprotein